MSDKISIEFDVTNTGKITGKEAVLLFVSDEVASVSPPVKKLKRFTKINLKPNEKQTINFELSSNDLAFVNRDNKWITEAGYFTIKVAGKSARFYVYK